MGSSTYDKAAYEQLKNTGDGGWTLGTDEEYMRNKFLLYARTPEERTRAEEHARQKAAMLPEARKESSAAGGRLVISPAQDVNPDHLVYNVSMKPGEMVDKHDKRNKELQTMTGSEAGFVQVVPGGGARKPWSERLKDDVHVYLGLRRGSQGRAAAGEEVSHAHNYTLGDGPRQKWEDEVRAAISGITGWALSDRGGGHAIVDGESLRGFLDDLSGRVRESGGTAEEYLESLDIPDNSKMYFLDYLNGDKSTKEFIENPLNWTSTASTGRTEMSRMAAQKGGDLSDMSNFLATDEVPPALFGVPVVSAEEQYTEKDLAFFKEHPEAGGYYDMGGEDA